MVDPRDLIGVARTLSSGAAPSDAALRRAISTAYYALFHAIAAFAADRLIGPAGTAAAYALVYRGLDHKRIRDVLDDASKPTLRLAMRDALRRTAISGELRGFAEIFTPLQQLRHLADYHPEGGLTPSQAADVIDEAQRALDVLTLIDPAKLTDIVTYMLIGARGI